jgi:hypothetical protein
VFLGLHLVSKSDLNVSERFKLMMADSILYSGYELKGLKGFKSTKSDNE